MMPLISIVVLILTSAYAAEDTSLAPQQHDCGGLRGDGSCAATTTSVCKGVQNFASAAGRVRRCSKIEGDLLIDHVELASLPFLTEVTGSIYIGSQPQYDGGNLHTLRREKLQTLGDDDDTEPALVVVPRTVNGTGHTGPSEFCATSI